MNSVIRLLSLAFAMAMLLAAASFAHARDRLDPAYQGGDIRVCRGTLTSSGTCIGSESNIEPPSYDCDPCIYREHTDRDSYGEHRRRHRRDDDEELMWLS